MRYFFTHLTETERTESLLPKERFNEVLVSSIAKKLRNSYIHNITHHEKKINFSAPVFRFVWNGFNLFNPISKGEISLKNIGRGTYISYKLFFWEFFIYCMLFSIIPFMGIFPNNFFRFIVLGIIWMIYAISTLIATNRFEIYLKKLVDEINLNVKK
ncbi:MAG: hypothetical protein JXL97_14175 [Bacteroidales bacterium]|nr:hypothetical protein [Bacteroidales bacterium]